MPRHFITGFVIALLSVGVSSTTSIVADGDERKPRQTEKAEAEKAKPKWSRHPIHIVMPTKGEPEIARIRVPWGKWDSQWIPLTKMKEGLWVCEAALPPAVIDGELWIASKNEEAKDKERQYWLKKTIKLRKGTLVLDSVEEGKNGFTKSNVIGGPIATLYYSYTASSENTTSVECETNWMPMRPRYCPMSSMGGNKWHGWGLVYSWNHENSEFSAVFIETRTAKDGTKTIVRVPVDEVNIIGFAHASR